MGCRKNPATLTAAEIGVYTARVRARGVTFEGQSFEREQRLTEVALDAAAGFRKGPPLGSKRGPY